MNEYEKIAYYEKLTAEQFKPNITSKEKIQELNNLITEIDMDDLFDL